MNSEQFAEASTFVTTATKYCLATSPYIPQSDGAHFVLRNAGDRVRGADRQIVDVAAAGKMKVAKDDALGNSCRNADPCL